MQYHDNYLKDYFLKKESGASQEKTSKITFSDLPLNDEITRLFISFEHFKMHYEDVINDPTNDNKLSSCDYLFDEIKKYAQSVLPKLVSEYRESHLEGLKRNPLLIGIVDFVANLGNISSKEDAISSYEEYNKIQKNNPLEQNWQNYIDMGCILVGDKGVLPRIIRLEYPVTLCQSYYEHGGNHSYVGPYMWPEQLVDDKTIVDLCNANPHLLKHKYVAEACLDIDPDLPVLNQYITFSDLPHRDDISSLLTSFELFKRYYNKCHKDIATKLPNTMIELCNDWFNEIKECSQSLLPICISKYRESNLEGLKKNPLLMGLVDLVANLGNINSMEDAISAYEEYNKIQKNNPLEENWQYYIDMGCTLFGIRSDESDFYSKKVIALKYPTTLCQTYIDHGGNANGFIGKEFLPAEQLLDDDTIVYLCEENPNLMTFCDDVALEYAAIKNRKPSIIDSMA